MTTMWELINAARAANGLPPYAVNARLTQSAQRHAADIAGNPVHTTDPAQYHIGTDGSTIYQRIRDTGYEPAQWSEVTGWGFNGDKQAMLNWWLNSPTHRPIILNPNLTECGIVLLDVPGTMWRWYWCIDFAKPKPGAAIPSTVYMPILIKPLLTDMLDYLRGDGCIYDVRHRDGSTETFQTQADGDLFWQVKNSQWEALAFDGNYIWRGVDTSPGPLHGRNRAYIQWESGREMARWCPRYMAIGQTWHGFGHQVQFRYKDDCSLSPDNSGHATNVVTLVRHLPSLTFPGGFTVEDVIELRSGGTNETMIYARGYGLVGWRNDEGMGSEIVAVYGKGERGDLVRERCNCFD